MKASELIRQLQSQIALYGDNEVYYENIYGINEMVAGVSEELRHLLANKNDGIVLVGKIEIYK